MKKLLLLFVALATFTACDDTDDYDDILYTTMPTDSATVPENMTVGETYEMTIQYTQPSTCYVYDSLYYYATEEESEDEDVTELTQVRTIAVINRVYEDTDCVDADTPTETTFMFLPESAGEYIFKFWTGTDEEGEDTFIEIVRTVDDII